MHIPHVALVVALLAASCTAGNEPLPEPAVRWDPAQPAMTPLPAPNPVCFTQMGQGHAGAEPRKLRHVMPRYPTRRTPTRFNGTMWVGVAEIGVDGSVSHIRTLRPLKKDPPWPEFEDAISAAIRQWKYEPRCVNGQPVKTDLTVTVHIHL